ncbi:MAG: uroporphyrinogen-III synthase [Chitinophagaceae bacterium]
MNNQLTILSTRELEAGLVEELLSREIVFDQIPFIEMIPRNEPGLAGEVNSLTSVSLLAIFTSRTSIAAVEAMLEKKPGNWKIACMGGATRKQAADLFGENAIVLTSGSAKELGEKLLVLENDGPIVFFAGNRRLNELPDVMEKNGKAMRELIVYDTIETPVKVDEEYDAILFFSPSAAQSYFSVNSVPQKTVLFSIGETTAAVLRKLAPNKVLVSPIHSPERLIETVLGYFGRK